MQEIVLCVSTGRSGTSTITKMIQDIFEYNQHMKRVYHERDGFALYNLYASYSETGDKHYLEQAHNLISAWEPGCAIVGNGYQMYLEDIHRIHNGKVKLIHLQRERGSCLASFEKNVEYFPSSHYYYSEKTLDQPPTPEMLVRYTAFHFQEMQREEWMQLPLREKLAWYYDKTHELIRKFEHLFSERMHIKMEDLSAPQSINHLTKLVNRAWQAPGQMQRHVNADWINFEKIDVISEQDRSQLNAFYQDFDPVLSSKFVIEGEKFFWTKILSVLQSLPAQDKKVLVRQYQQSLQQKIDFLEQLF